MTRRILAPAAVFLAILALGAFALVQADDHGHRNTSSTPGTTSDGSATIIVTMPAGMQLWIEGSERYPVQQMTSERILHTPPLRDDRTNTYTLEWGDGQKQDVVVRRGETVRVSLPMKEEHAEDQVKVFEANDEVKIPAIPNGAKKIQVWFCLPANVDSQKLLSVDIDGLQDYQLIQQGANRYVYAVLNNPAPGTLTVKARFRIACEPVSVKVSQARSGTLSVAEKKFLADYLKQDDSGSEVTPAITKIAQDVCKSETNVALQTELLFDYVIKNTREKETPLDPAELAEVEKKRGSAAVCLEHKEGSCIDQHALFAALARARGIPVRLRFGWHEHDHDDKAAEVNKAEEIDHGYHCWAEYYVPQMGWVPVDVADASGEKDPVKRKALLHSLDAHRICFFEGRNVTLGTGSATEGPKVNIMLSAYVLSDGAPLKWERSFRFTNKHATARR